MKKQLIVALGLAVIATPVFASKARLEALGEDNFGSYYINDNRNQFLNPAQINNHKDLITFEFGTTGNGTSDADAVKDPKAVGGLNKAYGNMVYGLYFGDATPTSALIRNQAAAGADLQEQNPIDLFVGGDAGVKWGANVTYDNFDGGEGATRLSSNALRLRGGVIMGDMEAFAHVSLAGDANDYRGNKVEGKTSYFAGVGQLINGNKLFADYKFVGAEVTEAGSKDDFDFTEARLGFGRVERLNDKANMYAKINVERRTTDDDQATTGSEVERYLLPVNLGLETEASSWLTFRASVGHNIWSNVKTDPKVGSKTSTHLANTAVRAGATLKFGELSVDGLISTNADGDATAPGTAAANSDTSVSGGNGALRTDSLLTRVAMTYRF